MYPTVHMRKITTQLRKKKLYEKLHGMVILDCVRHQRNTQPIPVAKAAPGAQRYRIQMRFRIIFSSTHCKSIYIFSLTRPVPDKN